MEKRTYIYMAEFEDNTPPLCIMYYLGRYCVGNLHSKGEKLLVEILRQYKTVSGAERYLKRLSEGKSPNYSEDTEEFIRKGTYWRD